MSSAGSVVGGTAGGAATDAAAPAEAYALELRALRKSFGPVEAVRDVELQLRPGEFFTLLGPSGSGKTTILKMVAGFEAPDGGEIIVHGRPITSLAPARRGIGLVFQHYALFPHMTVAQNLAYPLRRRRVPRREWDDRIRSLLALVRLEGLEQRRPHELSGGQQQRVAVARALSAQPAFLLLDEPLGALDRLLRLEMQRELRRIHDETGTTALYVTHDRDEALSMSDRVGVMRAGRLVQVGTPREVFERPASVFAAQLLGECNLVPLDDVADAGDGRVRATVAEREVVIRCRAGRPAGGWVGIVRPGDVRLTPRDGDVSLDGRVRERQYLGEQVRLTVTTELGDIVAVVAGDDAAQAPGAAVTVAFSPEKLFCTAGREGDADG
ncbi:MAG TPA: ABC transporter ATP-binding protein [Gaiellaceae bacterium]|jgi:ABC-type Fe3+/spermidine/putrescine transport system ATPase subunit